MSDSANLFNKASGTLRDKTIVDLIEENRNINKSILNDDMKGIKVKILANNHNVMTELNGIIIKLYEHKALILCNDDNKKVIKSVFYGNFIVCDDKASQWL